MTTKINNAAVEWGGYDYGVELCGTVTPFSDYDQAKEYAHCYGGKLKMRGVYLTDWFDAK